MSSSSSAPLTILVTGANVGLGFEASRLLGQDARVGKVILACRNPTKAEAAKAELEQLCKNDKVVFQVLVMDVSNLESVRQAVAQLENDDTITTLGGLILNAGGAGGAVPSEPTAYGVPLIVAANVLGHALLVDLLLQAKKLSKNNNKRASIVYSGTEAARGVSEMGLKAPVLPEGGSLQDFVSIMDGSKYGKDKSFEAMYGPTKQLAALWMSSMARQHPHTRFVTISPGGSTGTTFARDMPWYKRMVFAVLLNTMEFFGKFHSVTTGAQRYIDALWDTETYQSGVFYASTKGVSGPVSDQSSHDPVFSNEKAQDNVNEALHKFLK